MRLLHKLLLVATLGSIVTGCYVGPSHPYYASGYHNCYRDHYGVLRCYR